MVEKLLDEVLEHDAVSSSLEYPGKKHAVLSIRRKDMIPTIPVKASNLQRCYTEGRPAGSSEANPFIAPRFIDEYIVFWIKLLCIV